jgi:cation diffusion facilitator CzcD-associated flavoprotein CzcO
MATRETDIAVIGGGLSGIALGSYLRMLYPDTTFHIYEREYSMGGTWHINQYPGTITKSLLKNFS